MKFNVVILSFDGYPYTHFFFDTAKLFVNAIESLGYDCVLSKNHLDLSRMNILFGCHLIGQNGIDLTQSNLNYIVLQSEIIKQNQINLANNHSQFQNVYLPIMRNAKAVWDNHEDQVNLLKNMGINAFGFKTGYHPSLNEITHKNKKDIDFLFYGSITDYRREMIFKLKEKNKNVAVLFDDIGIYRNDYIGRTKIHLNIKQSEQMSQLPFWKISYLLNNGGLVVSETCDDQKWLQDCFLHADSKNFFDLCIDTLNRNDIDSLAKEKCDHFKKIPMTDFVKPLIEALEPQDLNHK